MQHQFCKVFLGPVLWWSHWAERLRNKCYDFSSQFILRSRNDHSNFEDAAANTLQSVELFNYHWIDVKQFIDFLQLANFLELVCYFWNADTYHLIHFANTLTLVLFDKSFQILIVNSRWMSSTILIFKTRIPSSKFQKPVSQVDPLSHDFLLLTAVWEVL